MKASIVDQIKSFIASSSCNWSNDGSYRYFDEPLVGSAAASDPLFQVFQESIGSFHLLPGEWFELEFGAGSFTGGTVISWILPCSEAVLSSNRRESEFPSEPWAHTRFHGEQVNDALRNHVLRFLTDAGYKALAPSLSKNWRREVSERFGYASTWSERHAAHAAGLGTFSLNDGLITHKGIAHRCGSVITELVLDADERTYQGSHDFCLYSSSKKCGACIRRCPAGAISEAGHDKRRCFEYTRNHVSPAVNEKYRVTTPSCGLCQTKVPCERKVPGALRGE
jgi:epoxyqueuosine reductase